jgi:tetratricopeptide (TPR) repeat protein
MADQINRSGGADFTANDLNISGDVAGRDKIVQPTTYNYYGAGPAQPRRAELPHQPYFFGREDELSIIAEALDPESNGWGVLIDGPGGIGKTALAIRAGHLAPDNVYPTKIFLSAKIRELTPQGEQKLEDFMLPNYMALLAELARELGDEGIERIDPNERPKEVRRLLENSHALIIIDNLETFDQRERERLFQFLKRLPRSCKTIVTSRRRTDVAAEIIRLDRLSAESTQTLIAKLAERNKHLARATYNEREELYEVTKGNPLLIEWIAGQLGRSESNCRTIADACRYLETAHGNNDPLEYVFGDLLDTFTSSEIVTLAALSYFTRPSTADSIANVAGISKSVAQTILEDLADRSIVLSDVQSINHALPPLTTTFLRRKKPSEMAQVGNRLADQIYALVLENGDLQYDRFSHLEDEWGAIEGAISLFLAGDNDRLQNICRSLATFLLNSGRWDERLTLSLKCEERAVAENDLFRAGWRAFDSGRVYFLRGHANDVMQCADRAESYWTSIAIGIDEQATPFWLRGLSYQLQKNYPAAIAAFNRALELDRTRLPSGEEDLALDLNSLGTVERLMGGFISAERHFKEALEVSRRINERNRIAESLSGLAELALDRKDWLTAETLAREGLGYSEQVSWKEQIGRNLRIIAKSLAQQGLKAESRPYAQRAVEIFTKLRSPDLADAQAVLRECGA